MATLSKTSMKAREIMSKHGEQTEIAGTVLADFWGDYSDAIAYCAKIADNNGPLADDYRQAAKIIKSQALINI